MAFKSNITISKHTGTLIFIHEIANPNDTDIYQKQKLNFHYTCSRRSIPVRCNELRSIPSNRYRVRCKI